MDKLHSLAQTLKPSPLMPVLFIGHGNPMNALLDTDITRNWERAGTKLPPAQALVVVSAHWLTKGTKVTDAPSQPILYDFYGFPEELYKVKYQADGDPAIALQLTEALVAYEAKLDSTWGLDHGTWSVLKHFAPKPKIPVLQISLDYTQSLQELTEMFKILKPLRELGVVFIGSGNVVHNLGAVRWGDAVAFDWAIEFDAVSSVAMANHDLRLLTQPRKLSNAAQLAVPTDDHYRPMLAAMALLNQNEDLHFFNDLIEMGSVGMRSFSTSAV